MKGSCEEHVVIAPIVVKIAFVLVSIVVLLCGCFGLEFGATVPNVVCTVVQEVGSSAFIACPVFFIVLTSVILDMAGLLNLALQ